MVFFEGITHNTDVSVKDMAWVVIHEQCDRFEPIGFGFPVPGAPVTMLGRLTSGSIHSTSGGNRPLIALIFFVPKKTATFTLLGPQGKEHILAISADWLPSDANIIPEAKLSDDGNIRSDLVALNSGLTASSSSTEAIRRGTLP